MCTDDDDNDDSNSNNVNSNNEQISTHVCQLYAPGTNKHDKISGTCQACNGGAGGAGVRGGEGGQKGRVSRCLPEWTWPGNDQNC